MRLSDYTYNTLCWSLYSSTSKSTAKSPPSNNETPRSPTASNTPTSSTMPTARPMLWTVLVVEWTNHAGKSCWNEIKEVVEQRSIFDAILAAANELAISMWFETRDIVETSMTQKSLESKKEWKQDEIFPNSRRANRPRLKSTSGTLHSYSLSNTPRSRRSIQIISIPLKKQCSTLATPSQVACGSATLLLTPRDLESSQEDYSNIIVTRHHGLISNFLHSSPRSPPHNWLSIYLLLSEQPHEWPDYYECLGLTFPSPPCQQLLLLLRPILSTFIIVGATSDIAQLAPIFILCKTETPSKKRS